MKHAKCYREGYPRPQFVREEYTDLCGEWSFAFDDEDAGEGARWFERFPEGKKILVPFSYQTEASGIGDTGVHEAVWYARRAEYDGRALKKKRLLLHFEGCDYFTKVWVNGEFVGSHRGGYCRFSFDITEQVKRKKGEAFIVVRAEDTLEAVQPRGKQSDTGLSFGCMYTDTTGIWKKVWTEIVSENYLESVKITPSFRDYYVEFEAALHKAEPGCSLDIRVTFGDGLISETTVQFTRRIANVKADLHCDADFFRVYYWTPEHPNIYDVEFVLRRETEVLDRVGSYFALAEYRAEGNCLVLNCNPVYMKMVLVQGYYRNSGMTAPDEQAYIKDILLAKELGFNGIRMHQKIEDERFYYYADILGMMVWCEMPSPFECKSETADKLLTEWTEAVRQNYNHPAIVAWVPINESWGVPRIVCDGMQQALSLALVYATKAYDGRRPVISNDGWEHTESDIVTLHNYDQDPEGLYRFYGDLPRALRGENVVDYMQTRLPFAKGFAYRGQPVIVSEFAGIGYRSGAAEGWGYGGAVKSAEEFVSRLKGMVSALRRIDGICGFCVTQLTDVETEINGLTDIDRNPKAPVALLRDAIAGGKG